MSKQVYLSHRRESDDLSSFGKELVQSGQRNNFDVLVDKYDAEQFSSIEEFIDSLKSTNGTIFLLDGNFFESYYCVSELCSHYKLMEPYCNAIYVVLDDWVTGDVPKFFENEAVRVKKYWEKQEKDPENFAEISNIFDYISLHNCDFKESDSIHSGFSALWTRLTVIKDRKPHSYSPPLQKDIDKNVQRQIQIALLNCPELVVSLEGVDARSATGNLTDIVDPEKRIVEFIRCAEMAVRSLHGVRQERVIGITHQIAFCLCHSLLSHDECLNRLTVRPHQVLDGPIEVREYSEVVAHLVASSTVDTASFTAAELGTDGSFLPSERQAIAGSKIVRDNWGSPLGWYHGFLKSVWHIEFPDDEIAANDLLDSSQIELLGRTVYRKFIAGRVMYYVIPQNKHDDPFNKFPAIVRQVKDTLPYLLLIKTGVENQGSVIRSGLSELDLKQILSMLPKLEQE